MLELVSKKYKDCKLNEALDKFYASPFYILVVAIIAVLSNFFGLEKEALIIYMIICALIPFIFTNNLNTLIAPFFFGYITVSKINNFSDEGKSLLSIPGIVPLFIVCGIILVLIILTRIILNVFVEKRKYSFPKFLISIFIFAVASTLGGVNTEYYAKNTMIFGLMVGLFMLIPYICLFFIVDFSKIKDNNFAHILLLFAIALIAEEAYQIIPNIDALTSISAGKVICRTGWGICNNIGGELVLTLGGSAYLALKHKGGFFYLTTLLLTYVATIFTFSRSAIIFGALVLLASLVLIFAMGTKKRRIEAAITLVIFLAIAGGLYYWKKDRLNHLFEDVLKSLIDGNIDDISSGRMEIYEFGFNQFLENPVFGVGYFKLDIFQSQYLTTGIVPSRYHNTFIQIVASTGLAGLLAYIYHRFETIRHLIKHYSKEKLFIAIAISGLLLTSLLDCHLFNLGPTMQYSVLLLLLEADTINKKEQIKRNL